MKSFDIITLTMLTLAVGAVNADMGNWKDLYTERGKDAFVNKMKEPYIKYQNEEKNPLRSPSVRSFINKLKASNKKKMYPVMLVTALLGAQLEAKLDRKSVPYFYCKKKSKWELIWVNIEDFLPFIIDCWEDNIKLKYDAVTHVYSPAAEGVQVRVRTGIENIRFIDPSGLLKSLTGEYNTIINALESIGYQQNKNLIAAPYDWRVGADSYYLPNGIFHNLKKMIEGAYANNSNTPVVCVAESLGNPVLTLFLNTYVSEAWKAKYIKSYIALAGVFAGAGQTVAGVLSPILDGLPDFIDPNIIRTLARSFGSIAWLFPNAKYWKDYVFLSTPTRNYTASDIGALLEQQSLHGVYEMYLNNKDLTTLQAPNVTVYCWHGIGVKTPNIFQYDSDNFDQKPKVIEVDGDGRVPLPSLQVCRRWKDEQSQPVSYRSLPGVTHVGILSNERVVLDILSVATGGQPFSD
ncbi:Group XV phospholipase A2 [Trichoplax sp. H2]|uniref:Group XV phospholipase A2 n=1 Tax=Trichoplax adhaerens TaxID=10228 RepID=B3S5F8_TRIAD|nr:hypothetical protein TRIADDRAFT_59600 [Trichoplax adhaerens]EDV22034.1 hypothetical protein TRIADDRAFT_59600 [Trichoplax adhaerens]RDD37003.1 Group XV phospholipase A2 [Trichoplax sp. H2]|eukprot:XP_002115671.1 hypothetical protein TRIADDRAFT_59600 [Trichoplax adhaerens]